MLFLDNQQQILYSIVRQISGEFLLELQDEEDFIKESVSTRIDLLSKLEQSLKQSVGTIGAISSRKTTDSSTRSAGSSANKSIGSVDQVNDKKETRPEATKKEDIGDDKQEIKSKIEPVAGKKERSVPKLSKAPSDFVPLASANPIQQSLAELRKGIAAANVKKSQYRITNSIAINDTIPRESNFRISILGTNTNRQSIQKDDSLDSLPGDDTIQDLVDMSLNLDQESIVLDTPRQLATTSTSSNTTKVLNTPTQTKQIQNLQLHSNTPKKVPSQGFQGTPLKNEIIPKAVSPTTVKKAAPEFKKPIPVSQDGFKSPFKSPANLYKGQATSFLAPSVQVQDSAEDKPLYSFLQGVTKKPIVKPKIEVKSLQLAQAAAKRERLEKERKQKLKEERELKTKKMMEIRKHGEMKPIESKKPDFKKVELKSTVEVSKKPELVGIKRTAETQLAAPKKLLKLQSPTKIVKKMPLNPTTSNNAGRSAGIKNPILVENKHNPSQQKNTNNSIVNNGEIQGIEEYLTLISSSDSESDHESQLQQIKPKPQLPSWAQSPILKETLKKQQVIDPDSIFEELEQPNIQEIMGQGKVRPSVAGDFYTMEGISAEEQREYKVQMKYANLK